MMKSILMAFAAALGLLVGCSSSPYAPITDPSARIEAYGFSILPPQGTGWMRVPDLHLRGSDGVLFGKQGTPGSFTHTVGAGVVRHVGVSPPASSGFGDYAKNPEVFAAFVKYRVEQANPPGGRMRVLEITSVPDTRFGYGAKVHARFEDHGSSVAPRILIQEDWMLAYLHPDSPGDMVEVIFSERGLPGERDPSLEGVREHWLESLQFRPLR